MEERTVVISEEANGGWSRVEGSEQWPEWEDASKVTTC